jgi:hypothetical protein
MRPGFETLFLQGIPKEKNQELKDLETEEAVEYCQARN